MVKKKRGGRFLRLTGRAEPLDTPSLTEIALGIVFWCIVAVLVIIFWPSHGAFVYEGF